MELVKKRKGDFRIYIYNLKNKESRCVTLYDGNTSIDDMRLKIINALGAKQ